MINNKLNIICYTSVRFKEFVNDSVILVLFGFSNIRKRSEQSASSTSNTPKNRHFHLSPKYLCFFEAFYHISFYGETKPLSFPI